MGSCTSLMYAPYKITPSTINQNRELIDIRGKNYLLDKNTYELYNPHTLQYLGVFDEYHLRIVK